jgi:hypothetical protein
MLKRIAYILAALTLFSGCIPFNSTDNKPAYSISGEIIDPDASLSRLLADMHVTATDKLEGKVYAGAVGSEDAKTCRYSLKDIPSGEYVLTFSSPFYEKAEYSLDLKGDKTLDVSLSPIPQIRLDVQEIHIAPRVKSTVFSVTNLTEREITLNLKPEFEIDRFIENLSGFQKASETIGWRCNLAPGETRQVTLKAKHDDEESIREGLIAINVDGIYQSSLPFVVETTSRDFFANLVGRVTDMQGKPLKDISVYCNCTDTIVLTDADGHYSFDDLPYMSQVSVIALSEIYNWKQSEFKEYVRDEIDIDLALEPCTNHLTFDRKEIDFGTGSISHAGNPVSFEINVTAETDAPVQFQVLTKVIGGNVYPGLNYIANGTFQSSGRLWFQLDRSVGNVGDFAFSAILRTDCAGVYLIPIKFSNTE